VLQQVPSAFVRSQCMPPSWPLWALGLPVPSISALRPRCLPCGCSQPPLLSRMVAALHGATGDKQVLCEAFPLLVAEHAYWTAAPKSVQVRKHHTCAVQVGRIMHGTLAWQLRYWYVASRCLALV